MSHPHPVHYVQVHPSAPPNGNESADAVLLARLRAQVEFYFSAQNLARDTFLRSLLSSTEHIGAVPVEIIANFPKVRELYAASIGVLPPNVAPPADPRLVNAALEDSQVVVISEDGKWISPRTMPASLQIQHSSTHRAVPLHDKDARLDSPPSPSSQTTSTSSAGVPTFPMLNRERNTVIVRDLPEDCTEEQIMGVFETDQGRPKSARLEVGKTWYITFATEAQAIAAVSESRGKEIGGMPVRARIKSEIPNVPAAGAGAANTPHQQQRAPPPYSPMPPMYANPYPFVVQSPGFAPAYPYTPYGVPGMAPQPMMMPPPQMPMSMSPFDMYHHQAYLNGAMMRPPDGVPGVIPVDMRNQKKRQKQKRARERARANNQGVWKRRDEKSEESSYDNSADRHQRNGSPSNESDAMRRGSGFRRRKNGGRQDSQKQLTSNGHSKPAQQPHNYSEANFPALAGDSGSKKPDSEKKQFGGYAQALLKKKTATADPHPETATRTEQVMAGIATMTVADENHAEAEQGGG